jgi:hypothetical protein
VSGNARPYIRVAELEFDSAVEAVAQALRSRLGCPLRLNPDGSANTADVLDIEASVRAAIAGYERRPRLVPRVDATNILLEKRLVIRWELDGKPVTGKQAEEYLLGLHGDEVST